MQGAMSAKAKKKDTVTVFIAPPSTEELLRRLCGRHSESDEQIAERLAREEYELSFAPRYDYTVVNDDLSEAYARLRLIIESERAKA